MNVIATRADLYGPASGMTLRDTLLSANGTSAGNNVQTTQQAVPVTTVFANLRGSIVAKPLTWLFALVGVLLATKLIEEHRGGQESFEEIKIGLSNVVKIGLMAMLFFVIAKFVATRYDVPGASPFIKYATGA